VQPLPDIRVSTVVMAHPDRRDQAERLRREHPELDIEIVFDPNPGRKAATLRTAKLAWSRVREGASHHLVLQEDVELCEDFANAMIQALRVAPAGAISFFASWAMSTAQAVRLAAFAGASWTPVVDPWIPTQALVLPAPLARRFAAHAERYSDDKPDNRVMAEFLAEHGLTAYVSIPNLVEHGSAKSLLLNDLLWGIRASTVLPGSEALGAVPFTDAVAAPAAVAHLGRGDFGAIGHFESLRTSPDTSTIESHKVLLACGMSTLDLAEGYSNDVAGHPSATASGFSESMLFHLWLTMFVQGIIARGMLGPTGRGGFDSQLERSRWARDALDTFAASALHRTYPDETIRDIGRRLTPLCVAGMRSGFAAVDRWPRLRALDTPDEATIKTWREAA
jgi:hypothetical protein